MIIGLDGLRALAFLGVFSYHTGNLEFGWMGVQLFFVLSGFLITEILLRMKNFASHKGICYKILWPACSPHSPGVLFLLIGFGGHYFHSAKIKFGIFDPKFQQGFSSSGLVCGLLCL